MPDLPELYEALDDNLTLFLGANKPDAVVRSRFILALCAAIEVKQTQELHGALNWEELPTPEELFGKTTTAGHQEEEAEA